MILIILYISSHWTFVSRISLDMINASIRIVIPVGKMFSQYSQEVGQEYLCDPHLDLYDQS